MIELKKCPVCKKSDWKNLDDIRNADYWRERGLIGPNDEVGFKICKSCGFLTYDYQTDKELKRRYSMNRVAINVNNIITQNRKAEYHKRFFLPAWKKQKGDFLDYGCSIGSLVKLAEGTERNAYGIELNDVDRNVASRYTKINAVENRQDLGDKKFGAISFYHVLEHLQDPDDALNWAREHLRDDGFLYIAVPVYDEMLEEASGAVTDDFENWFHLNHVNCFTYKSFRNLITQCGFWIDEENTSMYGLTCILKKATGAAEIVPEKWKAIADRVGKQKRAIEAYKSGDIDKAIEIWPKYPDAYVAKSLKQANYFDFKNNTAVLVEGLSVCGEVSRIVEQLASVYFQWDESRKGKKEYGPNTQEAERLYNKVLELRPGNENVYFFLGIIESHYKHNYDKAQEYFEKCIEMNPTKWVEMQNLILWGYQQ